MALQITFARSMLTILEIESSKLVGLLGVRLVKKSLDDDFVAMSLWR
jgi:hypothetical protein